MRVADIAARWSELLLRQYAGQSASFFSNTSDPFRNPVGQRFRESIDLLTGELLGDMDRDRVTKALGAIVEIRAVEAATPREALSFIFDLRAIAGESVDPSRIDELALIGFDLYVKCRERIYAAQVNEAKRRFYVMERITAGGEL